MRKPDAITKRRVREELNEYCLGESSAEGPPILFPRAQFEFYSIMSHASGNALGGAISPADVSFGQHMITIGS